MSYVAELVAKLSLDAKGFTSGLQESQHELHKFSQSAAAGTGVASKSVQGFETASNKAAVALKTNLMGALTGVVAGVGLMSGAFGLWKSIQVASRVEEMSVALNKLGQNAGLTSKTIDAQTKAIKDMGITTNVAQYTLSQFLKANLDVSKASDLARVAQDAAVYSMTDSSSSLQSLIYGIQTYQCLEVNEKVLTADLRWNAAGDVCTGDYLMAFDEDPSSEGRRWFSTLVTHSGREYKRCVQVGMSNGDQVVCSYDHPWLSVGGDDPPLWVEAEKLLGRHVLLEESPSGEFINPEYVEVVSVTPVGIQEIATIETESGTYVGAGYLHHNTEIFRTAGLNINVGKSFEDYAKSIKKNTSDLTEHERQNAVFNAVLKEGETIAGTYEAAMGTGSKQMRSFTRYVEEAQQAIGEAFLPVFSKLVFKLADATKAFGKMVEAGGALRPALDAIGSALVVPFTMMDKLGGAMSRAAKEAGPLGGSLRLVSRNLKDLVEYASYVGVAFGLWKIGTWVANWVLMKFAVSGANKALMEQLSINGMMVAETPAELRAILAKTAAEERYAAQLGITVVALREQMAAAIEARSVAAGYSLPMVGGVQAAGPVRLPGTGPGLGVAEGGAASGGAMLGGMGPMVALAAVAAGYMAIQGANKWEGTSKRLGQEWADEKVAKFDNPMTAPESLQNAIDNKQRRLDSMSDAQRNKYVKGTGATGFQQLGVGLKGWGGDFMEGARGNFGLGGGIVNWGLGVVGIGKDSSYDKAKASEKGTTVGEKMQQEIDAGQAAQVKALNARNEAMKQATKIGLEYGKSQQEVMDTANRMGINLIQHTVEQERQLKSNLQTTDESSVAWTEYAKALGEAANMEKTVEERSAALTSAMKALVSATYDVASSTRSSMDALASQDKSFKEASKTGGDTLKQYKQHWMDHNKTIADSFIGSSDAFRKSGQSVSEYLTWGDAYIAKAVEMARAQGQNTTQLAEYKKMLIEIESLNMAGFGRGKDVLKALKENTTLKFSSADVINAFQEKLKGQDAAQISLALNPHIDWDKMTGKDISGYLKKALEMGQDVNIPLLMSVVEPGTKIADLIKMMKTANVSASNPIVQQFLLSMDVEISPEMANMLKLLKSMGGHFGDMWRKMTGAAPDAKVPEGYTFMGMSGAEWNSMAQMSDEGIARGVANYNSSRGGGSGGESDNSADPANGKTAEQIARENRRRATASNYISSTVVPETAKKAYAAFTDLGELEDFFQRIKQWRETYTGFIKTIVDSSSEGAARIATSWALPEEQMANVAETLARLGQNLASFATITTPNFLTSGRAANKIEEWIDGILELEKKGLNPLLMRQLIEAGPESLGAVRRLIRGGSAMIGKANDQWNRIQDLQTRFAEGMGPSRSIGVDINKGIAEGIYASTPEALRAAQFAAEKIITEMKKALGIESPSKVAAEKIGKPIIDGIVYGMEESASAISTSIANTLGGINMATTGPGDTPGRSIENHFHVAGFVVDKTSVDAMISAQDWALQTSGGR
ncbi:hypothetical protein UFOVP978_33 [uncultured Caudovirales phage]|uniref:Uncharacterized protein n=1 Tax=uncultured Caudovirales phage TaxID=2100421 RepID=A0A6J5Q527_9CAUD|nr:hypothetical protein UFOVP978_33 [uncultured Caudovirales phage]